MIQKSLFDRVYPPTEFADTCSTKSIRGEVNPIARRSDPITSHKSAARIESTRSETQQRCLEVLKKSNTPLCANRLATACCNEYGCEGTDKQKRNIWDNYRKRSHEIFRNAELTVEVGRENGARVFRAKVQR